MKETIFQQDRARPHNMNAVIHFLNTYFNDRTITNHYLELLRIGYHNLHI